MSNFKEEEEEDEDCDYRTIKSVNPNQLSTLLYLVMKEDGPVKTAHERLCQVQESLIVLELKNH